jgi:hypothetical protein
MARQRKIPAEQQEPLEAGEPNTAVAPTVDQTERPVSGAVAQGEAVAVLVIRSVKDSLTTGLMMLKEIQQLTQEGRQKFRAKLEEHLASIREQVRASGKTAKEAKDEETAKAHAMLKGAAAVWRVRISEYLTFAKAVDHGYGLEPKLGYAKVMTGARMLLASGVTSGPTKKRGRQRIDVREKVLKYLSDRLTDKGITPDEIKFLKALIPAVDEQVKAIKPAEVATESVEI